MSSYFYNDYQKKIFQYRYKFFLLAPEKVGTTNKDVYMGLAYRYWAETETFDPSIVEDIGEFPNYQNKSFTISFNLLSPEPYLSAEIEKFKAQILQEAREAKVNESKARCSLKKSALLTTPPAYWEFQRKQDIDPNKAQLTFDYWDHILEVYKLRLDGLEPTDILEKAEHLFSHLSSEGNNANKFRRIRQDIENAKKLIESALKGTFPVTD